MAKKKAKKKAVKKMAKKTGKRAGPVPAVSEKRKKKTKTTRKKSKGTCFVMMPFKPPFDLYYESIIEPAVRAAFLDPRRADSLFRPSPIVGDIWKMVQGAKVLLADVTTKNPNVFYELGLAHAVGKAVVLVSETIEDVPFDLQQLRVILYEKSDPAWGDKLKRDIVSALNETLDSPAESVPDMFRPKVKSQAPPQDATVARVDALEREFAHLKSRGSGDLDPRGAQLRREFAIDLRKRLDAPRDIAVQDLRNLARRYVRMGLGQREMDELLTERMGPQVADMVLR